MEHLIHMLVCGYALLLYELRGYILLVDILITNISLI